MGTTAATAATATTADPPRLVVLVPARNAEGDLPGFLESVERFADGVLALDDGSTDATRSTLTDHPLVAQVLTNPVRPTYAGWDDAGNRNRLLEAAAEADADWVLFLDADERIDAEDGAALRRFVDHDALPDFAYGFQVFRMVDSLDCYDPDALWVYRLFAVEAGQRVPDQVLHFVPVPTSIPDHRRLRTTLRIQHLGSLDDARRSHRRTKYREADPGDRFQNDYGNLLRDPDQVLPWQRRRPDDVVLLDDALPAGRTLVDRSLAPERPAITAIVIAQDDEAVIDDALRALTEQHLDEPFEVVVVGSGSDGTADRVRERYPPVRVVGLPRPVFPGEARNAGLIHARGEYVTFPGAHILTEPGYLAGRTSAHDDGWGLVTGTTRNGNPTPAGWASYLLDHSGVLPGLPSGSLGSAPAHCSYVRDDLDRIGGFPETVRAGEDTAVNVRLFAAGRTAFRSAEAVITHTSRARTVRGLMTHHHGRGRGWGRLLRTGPGRRWRDLRERAGVIADSPLRRYRSVRRNVAAVSPRFDGELARARPLVAAALAASVTGTVRELLSAAPVEQHPASVGRQHTVGVPAPWLVTYGTPLLPGGPAVRGTADVVVERARRWAARDLAEDRPQGLVQLVVTAAVDAPGQHGDRTHDLHRDQVEAFLTAAADAGLVLSIQPGGARWADVVRRWAWALQRPGVHLALEADHVRLPSGGDDPDRRVREVMDVLVGLPVRGRSQRRVLLHDTVDRPVPESVLAAVWTDHVLVPVVLPGDDGRPRWDRFVELGRRVPTGVGFDLRASDTTYDPTGWDHVHRPALVQLR